MNPEQILMRDPTTASSRIYVGNIQEGVTQADLMANFSKHGQIRGVLVNRGFGFIQFDSDISAQKAIQTENNSMFQGRKIIVRNAVKNTQQQQQQGGGGQMANIPGGQGGGNTNNNKQDNSDNAPTIATGQDMNRTARPGWSNRNNRNKQNNNKDNNSMNDNGRDRSPLDADKDNRWGGPNQKNRNFNNFDNMGPGGNNMFMNNKGGNFGHQPMHQHNNMPMMQQGMDRNDCEIIVVAKSLTQYAEAVEARLKRMGLIVDLLFPNEDVPIGKVLANIASRNCMYAILVTPQNEEHRSITVHVLHGQLTEHRNMPVEDAIEFIGEDFQEKMQGDRVVKPSLLPTAVEITPTSSYAAPPLNTRHPEAIQTLVNLLADNRPITVLQYDRVIRYLQERREFQLKAEIGDAPPDVVIPPPIDPEVELQKKIMDILNKPSITTPTSTVTSASATSSATSSTLPVSMAAASANDSKRLNAGASSKKPQSTSSKQSQPQLLNDPKVQKALDSLFQQGNLFNF